MKHIQTYNIFEKKKQKIKRLSEEEYKKEVEKNDGKQLSDRQRVEGIKTDDATTTII